MAGAAPSRRNRDGLTHAQAAGSSPSETSSGRLHAPRLASAEIEEAPPIIPRRRSALKTWFTGRTHKGFDYSYNAQAVVDGADQIRGVNTVGLKRSGSFGDNDIDALEDACRRLFYREKPFAVVMNEFDTMNGINPKVKHLVEFLRRRDQGKHGRYLEGMRTK